SVDSISLPSGSLSPTLIAMGILLRTGKNRGRANDTERAYDFSQGMQTAVTCPKCSYARQPADTAPAWQCPSCGIAYVKFSAKQLVVPPGAGEAAPPFARDGSIW